MILYIYIYKEIYKLLNSPIKSKHTYTGTAPQSVVTVMAANIGVCKPAFSGFISSGETEELLELSCGAPCQVHHI